MSDWALAVASLAALAAILTLAHRVVGQLLARVDAQGAALIAEMGRRFEEMESRRQEAGAVWMERLAGRDLAIDTVRRELHEHRQAQAGRAERAEREAADLRAWIAATYVPREVWIEQATSVDRKLDKIYERCKGLACEGTRHAA